ncbi:MAG: GDP-L-fucose synthase [Flavobacteriales bacterium]|nr:GDP-L-fucose synthase [Flavobacteriales bacterium]MCX7768289.1 GDP-L-fucose synthase [Flavobacteriales bacterium]MDW8410530.1 GDP-L-fucose synthase [Flavobacteriales bacterium]
MNPNSKIYVAGHRGMVGSAIVRQLLLEGYSNLVLKTSQELDLRDQKATYKFFEEEQPEYVFLAAARVGGVWANYTRGAEFIYDNIMIQTNVIDAARKYGVKKLLFLGSSCIYPRLAPQPMKEEYLLTGPFEPTNEPYALAKVAGLKMCIAYRRQYGCNFISIMPTNLYGPGDNYDLMESHVLPALLRKFHEAKLERKKQVVVWGSGSPMREFLHVNDLASACIFLMKNYNDELWLNCGSGEEISIGALAELIREIVNWQAEIIYDTSKPDGMPRKLLDSSRLRALGWQPHYSLREGITDVYNNHFEKDYAKYSKKVSYSSQ